MCTFFYNVHEITHNSEIFYSHYYSKMLKIINFLKGKLETKINSYKNLKSNSVNCCNNNLKKLTNFKLPQPPELCGDTHYTWLFHFLNKKSIYIKTFLSQRNSI
jgi:hypothetical protein